MREELRYVVAREAWSWLNTPWHDRARVRGVGVDCAQFPAAVYEAAGLIPHIEPDYVRQWAMNRDRELYLEWVMKFAEEIEAEARDVGDLAVWRYGRTFSHGGILLARDRVIHADMGAGVTLDETDRREDLRTRPVRYFSVRETS